MATYLAGVDIDRQTTVLLTSKCGFALGIDGGSSMDSTMARDAIMLTNGYLIFVENRQFEPIQFY